MKKIFSFHFVNGLLPVRSTSLVDDDSKTKNSKTIKQIPIFSYFIMTVYFLTVF